MSKGEKRNYGAILDGKSDQLTTIPSIYEFNETVGVHDTMDPGTLKNIANIIKDQNPKEHAKINKFLSQINWQISEYGIFDEVALFFSNCFGILISGYEPKHFLRVFVKDAEEQRRKMEKIGQHCGYLTTQEQNVLKALNIEPKHVFDISVNILNSLSSNNTGSSYSTTSIHKAINETENILFTKEAKELAKTKFRRFKQYDKSICRNFAQDKNLGSKKKVKQTPPMKEIDNYYAEEEIKEIIAYSVYRIHSQINAEWDFLVVLPGFKAIINIEVKKNSEECGDKNRNLRSASEQLEKHSRYFAEKHGYLLDNQWTFLKFAAIKPNVTNPELVCDHCKQFIITDERHIGEVWKNVKLKRRRMKPSALKNSMKQFNCLFRRLVSYSSATKQKKSHDLSHKLSNTTGNIKNHVFTGTPSKSNFTSDNLSFEQIREMPSTAMKILYMGYDQLGILGKRLVVFLSDFGTGRLS